MSVNNNLQTPTVDAFSMMLKSVVAKRVLETPHRRLDQAFCATQQPHGLAPRWVAQRLDPTYKAQRYAPTGFRPDGKLPEEEDDVLSASGGRIRCPACQWQPARKSRWFCMSMGPPENFTAGCGHGWNTFDTQGVCPGCLYHWKHTTCLSCSVTSIHADWYVKAGMP
jgi:hypothetical protein